jgi:predicted metal-binding protein
MGEDTIDPFVYLLYVPEYSALICRSCRYCLTPRGVGRHFQWQHKTISCGERDQLVKFAECLTVSRPEDIEVPSEEIAAIEGLDVIDGFKCGECEGLYGTMRSIQNHCRDRHDWVKSRGIYP